ncbi:putative hydrolase or acyltransferase of alpha/beta superfamily [Frankia sp. EI5c]|uniref:alpha/beta fold hydrolase n=1 Tax=Frankia sp. EI5c TaxID=683316 RepID=UPI0007C25CF6|nr:alpha/beta hydrolase [Frankia sp. EI5c]OAA21104.1 putative hydrolase or acyltransferase of alpha/beta superfamily [Frankia sp. EI5c]
MAGGRTAGGRTTGGRAGVGSAAAGSRAGGAVGHAQRRGLSASLALAGGAARAVTAAAGSVVGSRAVRRGGAVGLVGAALTAGLLAERRTVRRHRDVPDLPEGDGVGPIGGRVSMVVTAADGIPLHVEQTDQDPRPGPETAAPTLVFVHGFCVNGDSWVFQQRALRDLGPMVFYDLRAHGRSGPCEAGSCTIDQLAADLHQVLTERVPQGPIVLVGHSMGGMTIIALAGTHPELFRDRVAGVVLLSTSAGDLARLTLGLPALVTDGVRRALPTLTVGMRRAPTLFERARRRGSDFSWEITRRIAFGSGDVPPSVVSFLEEMVGDTPIPVMAAFMSTLLEHDKVEAVAGLRDTPTVILVGDDDVMTPPEHSRAIADLLPDAELRIEPGAGHAIMLERPAATNAAIRDLVERINAPRPVPDAVRP